MTTLEEDVKRMERQIEQLINIIANQNNRLNGIEDLERKREFGAVQMISLADRV